MKEFLKSVIFQVRNNIPRKVVYVAAGLALMGAAKACPEYAAYLPSQDILTDMVIALLACHTVTDVAALVGIAIRMWGQQKFGRKV